MTEVWRNMMRRRVRTSLTILGIIIGILALTVMGSLAERMNQMVDGAMRYYSKRIVVQDSQSPGVMAARPLSMDYAARLEAIDGVQRALPTLYMLLEQEPSRFSFNMPPLIVGLHPDWWQFDEDRLTLGQGRQFQTGERGVVVIGMDIAQKYGVAPGEALAVRGQEFRVVGVLDRTMTAPDSMVLMPLPDAQALYVANLPEVIRPQTSELTSAIEVFPKAGVSFDEVADRIDRSLPGVKATSPKAFQDEVRRAMVIFNALILQGAIIALVVGGLAIINTMAMAVAERTKEIGIRKAVGASTGHIIREYLLEAGAIGLEGGLVGLGLGIVATHFLNSLFQSQGVTLFTVTPRLAVGSIAFATFLGMLAGLYPAFRAARLDPVAALRSE